MAIQTINGVFRLKSVLFPDFYLNVYGTSIASKQNVCLYSNGPTDKMQQFVAHSQGNNVYKMATVASTKVVLDHYRAVPVDNCDVFTSGSSNSDGSRTNDLLDQQVQFDLISGTNTYAIYLYNGGLNNMVLTAASTADGKGCAVPTTTANIKQMNNVYWATKPSTLTNAHKWTMEKISPVSTDTVLSGAQHYVQRDNTWAYLTYPGEFDSLACSVCSLAMCASILKSNKAYTPLSCRTDKGFVYGDVTAQWANCGMSNGVLFAGDPANGYKKVLTELKAGRPVIMRAQKTASVQHYVTAYGYKSGTTDTNVDASRILIMDPYNPEYTDFKKLLDNCSGGYLHIKVKA